MSHKGPNKKQSMPGRGALEPSHDSALQHLHHKVRESIEKGPSLFYGEAKPIDSVHVPDLARGICASPRPERAPELAPIRHDPITRLGIKERSDDRVVSRPITGGDLHSSPSKVSLWSMTDDRSEPMTKTDDSFLPDVSLTNLSSTMTFEATGLMAALVQSSGEGRIAPWNPTLWLEARQQLLDDGRIKDLPHLMRFVRESSRRALQMKEYQTQLRGKTVNLGKHLMPAECVRWLGRRNVKVPQMPENSNPGDVQPPIIVVSETALDVIYRMTHSGPEEDRKRPIIMVVEACDFDNEGRLNLGTTRTTSMSQQNLIVRSDFQRFARQAANCIRSGKSSVRDHLTAVHDPYVFTCPNVTMFRGARDDGYPYLEKPVHFTCVVCAMPSNRPDVMMAGSGLGPKSEWYSNDLDQTALLERLCLIGYAAQQDSEIKEKAILVLSALGCTDRGLHPRDAVGNSMKHWRTRFARLFHTVFLATGPDRDLAEHFDLAINRQLYGSLLTQDVSNFAEWHWSSHHVSMHVNSVDLHVIADMVEEDLAQKEEERKRLEIEDQARKQQEEAEQVERDSERRERMCMRREDKALVLNDEMLQVERSKERKDTKCSGRSIERQDSGSGLSVSSGEGEDQNQPSNLQAQYSSETSQPCSRQSSKRSTEFDIHAQVGRAKRASVETSPTSPGKRASVETSPTAPGATRGSLLEVPGTRTSIVNAPEDVVEELPKSPASVTSVSSKRVTLMDDFALSAIQDGSRHHVSKTVTDMQVDNLYMNAKNANNLTARVARYSGPLGSGSASGSRAQSISDAHSHAVSRVSRPSMGSLVSAGLKKNSSEKSLESKRSGSPSVSEAPSPRLSIAGSRKQSMVDDRRASRRQSALEQRVRKSSCLGTVPKGGSMSARSSNAFGNAVVSSQCRASIGTPKKITDEQRCEQIRMDARRRLSNRKSCDQDFTVSFEDGDSPKTLSRSSSCKLGTSLRVSLKFEDEGDGVCTTVVEFPSVGSTVSDHLPADGQALFTIESEQNEPETSEVQGDCNEATDGEVNLDMSELAPVDPSPPNSPGNTSGKGVNFDSPRDKQLRIIAPQASPRITSPKDKRLRKPDRSWSCRFPEKMEEWEVRVNLQQLATTFKDSTERFWNSPRHKRMAQHPKPARRSSDVARSEEQQKAFETAMSEDLGHRQAEAQIKRAVKELGLDNPSQHMIPGVPPPLQNPSQPPMENKARASQVAALRVPVESPLHRKMSRPMSPQSTETPDPGEKTALPPLSPLRRSHMANQMAQRTSTKDNTGESPRFAGSARNRMSHDVGTAQVSTVSEVRQLGRSVTDAFKLEDIGHSGNMMTF